MFYTICIYSMFVFLIVLGLKREMGRTSGDYIRKFNNLRGIFALEIMIGHMVRYEKSLLYPLGKFMIISVAFFFFVSAMGLLHSWHKKTDYLRHFIFRRGGWLLAIAVVAFLYRIVWYLISGRPVQKKIFFLFLQTTNWYIWELLFFYILFYLVYKYMRRYQILVIFFVTLIMATTVYKAGMIQGYYSSAMAFPFGLMFYEYFERITQYLKSRIGMISVAGLTVLGLSSLLLGENSIWGMVYLRNVMCLSAICILFYFLGIYTVRNVAVDWLGKYSLEIYLYQFIFFELAGNILDFRIRIPLVCALTVLSALVLHPVNCWMKERIQHI